MIRVVHSQILNSGFGIVRLKQIKSQINYAATKEAPLQAMTDQSYLHQQQVKLSAFLCFLQKAFNLSKYSV